MNGPWKCEKCGYVVEANEVHPGDCNEPIRKLSEVACIAYLAGTISRMKLANVLEVNLVDLGKRIEFFGFKDPMAELEQ